jgi:hypothetical protein
VSSTTILTGVSIACVLVGVSILAVQALNRARRRSAPPPSARPAAPSADAHAGVARRRRRTLLALLVLVAATLAAALVVQQRLAWGVHLLVDDAFLAYVAVLARGAENRQRASSGALLSGEEPGEHPVSPDRPGDAKPRRGRLRRPTRSGAPATFGDSLDDEDDDLPIARRR